LCRSALTSPFSANRPETLARCNKESLEAGTKGQIVDFIRERVDPGLRNIELADQDRFLVSHDDFDNGLDLAAFGEGMRRVFEIGLLFAGVRGGVLLVDEFENAIHTELLVDFTRLVQQLAVTQDVQVFLSTHSKEAIDAFVGNGHGTDDVVGYAINRTNDVQARRYDGDRLRKLTDAVDFDLRGVR
jgi:predicted ATPase